MARMFPCSACQRHIRDTEPVCPFCATEVRATSADRVASTCVGALVLATALALGSSACARQATSFDEGDTSTEEPMESSSSSSESTTDPTTTESETTMGETTESTTESTNPGLSFYAGPEPDWSPGSECDPFFQDCPEGEKCVPYGSSGGNWDANKCVEILGDGQPGDACVYGGTSTSTDDCGADSFCWNVMDVDGESIGECTPFCQGTPDDPICPAGSACLITNEDSITLCLDTCDPLTQDCNEGLGCYWAGEVFICLFETQDIPLEEPCGYLNDCASGLYCAASELLPTCNGSACCTNYCSLAMPDCPIGGTQCVAFFDEFMLPPEYADVGVCILPQ